MSDPLEAFPVVISIPVAWGEMDAFQHVNNSVYFRYFDSRAPASPTSSGSISWS
jgi:acyl-CoA thioester hydrolase